MKPPEQNVRAIAAYRVWVFLGLTVLFSSVFWTLAIATGHDAGGGGAYAVGVMWCPGLAALATCALCGIPLSTLGWRWGNWRYQGLAYLVPLAYAAVAYAIVWATGLGGFPNPAFVEKTRQSLAWPGSPAWLVIAGWFFFMATTGVVRSVASALGEEIGWRGFLSPQLSARFGFTGGALLTGAIWTAWHMPVLIFADYNSGTPWWFALSCFAVMVISMSVVMSWLRLRSGSLWTGAIFHASHNTFIQAVLSPLTTRHGSLTAYVIDEFGFMIPLITVLVAIVFWRRRKEAMAAAFPPEAGSAPAEQPPGLHRTVA